MVLELQTHKEICTRGLILFATHLKKKKKVLGVLGPLDFVKH